MNIHTRLVGALDAIILSLIVAVHIAMLFVLLDPSYDPSERLAGEGTVTIQQLAMVDSVARRQL